MSIEPREYQDFIVGKISSLVSDNNSVILELDCGMGKRVLMYRLLTEKDCALTTHEVADLMERARPTAYRFMATLEASHLIPVYYDPKIGAWRILKSGGDEHE